MVMAMAGRSNTTGKFIVTINRWQQWQQHQQGCSIKQSWQEQTYFFVKGSNNQMAIAAMTLASSYSRTVIFDIMATIQQSNSWG